jgi:hypothetical protein
MNWNDQEFVASREHQAGPDQPGATDVLAQRGKVAAMAATPPGEPPVDYDVRSVYDSRPVNSRDFNISGTVLGTVSGSGAIVFPVLNFNTPLGWRFVVLEWEVTFAPSLGALGPSLFAATSVNLLQGGGVADPFNTGIIIGPNGTGAKGVETFMLVEEQTLFGIQIVNADTTLGLGLTSTAIVTIHGNALPVMDVQLPYSIANPVRGLSMRPPSPLFFPPPVAPPPSPGAPPVPPPAAPAPVAPPAPQMRRRGGGFSVTMPPPIRRRLPGQ